VIVPGERIIDREPMGDMLFYTEELGWDQLVPAGGSARAVCQRLLPWARGLAI
jgi:hypothetical protein